MNKKLGIVFIFALLVGAVFLGGCSSLQQDAVGRKIAGDLGVQQDAVGTAGCDEVKVDCGTCHSGNEDINCPLSTYQSGNKGLMSCTEGVGCTIGSCSSTSTTS